MRHIKISVDVRAHPSRLWAVLSDFERWPEWTSTVTSIKRMSDGPVVPGSRLLIRQPKLPPAVWVLTEIREGWDFVWVNRGPGIKVFARHGVQALGDGTSRATLSLEFQGLLGGLIGRLTARMNERYLAIEAAGLKNRVENGWGASAG